MEKTYLVWREGEEEREDAKRVKALYASQAAENWAEWADSWSADYTIVRGTDARVFVALDDGGTDAELFSVSGETRAIYHALPAAI